MGQLDLPDPERRKPFSYDFKDHQTPPKSPNPYANYMASVNSADRLRKHTKTKLQNQNPSDSSSAPNTNITGGPSGGRRAPNTNTGGSGASNMDIGSATGGAVSANTPSLSSSSSSSSSIQLQFGNFRYDPSLDNSTISHIKFASNAKTSSPPQVTSSSSEVGISSSDHIHLSSSPSTIQLQFGNLKYDPSLLNTSHIKFASNAKTTSPPQVSSSSSSEAGISRSDIHKLQRLIKLAIAAGRLRSKCRKCGNSVQHCCEQTILEAVFSLPQLSNS